MGIYRSHQNPKDIVATLTLMVIVMMLTVQKQFHIESDGFSIIIIAGVAIAIAVLYLVFYLFPGEDESFYKDDNIPDTPQLNLKVIVLKATAIYLVLMAW